MNLEALKAFRSSDHAVHLRDLLICSLGITDEMYEQSGAKILETAADVYAKSEIIVKVKELQKDEFALLKNGQTVLSYAHLAIA